MASIDLSNGTTLRPIYSGRTVSLNSPESFSSPTNNPSENFIFFELLEDKWLKFMHFFRSTKIIFSLEIQSKTFLRDSL